MNRLFKILLPVMNVLTVGLLLFLDNNAYNLLSIAPVVLFVLCYDFLLIFYIENHEDYILLDLKTMLMILAAILSPYIALHFEIEWLFSALILLAAVITVNCINLNFSILCSVGIMIYGFLYFQEFTRSCFVYVIVSVLIAILTESMKQKKALFYSLEIGGVVYLILLIVKSGFTITDVFSLWNMIFLGYTLCMILFTYFLKFKYASSYELAYAADTYLDNMEDTENVSGEILWQNQNATELIEKNDSGDSPEPASQAASDEKGKIADSDENEKKLRSELEALREENYSIKARIEALFSTSTSTVEDLVSENSPYLTLLKDNNRHLFNHSRGVAILAYEAAELINCDAETAKVIGLYHEAGKVYPRDLEETLFRTYRMPKIIIKSIVQIKDKSNNSPLSREAGIVMLCDDIYTMVLYVKKKPESDISVEKIINNTFRVRKDQGMLRLAGFSNEEVQLLKLYFNEKRDFYDIAD